VITVLPSSLTLMFGCSSLIFFFFFLAMFWSGRL
jgi:hypothetical protein